MQTRRFKTKSLTRTLLATLGTLTIAATTHAVTPGNVIRQQWQVGDVIIWDNRCVLHRRDDFDAAQRRLLRRCQVLSPETAVAS